MPRYVRQYDRYSCGPVAIINALKWCGRSYSLKNDLRKFQHACRCGYMHGTRMSDLDWVLRKFIPSTFVVKRKRYPVIGDIEKHLKVGGIVILNFAWKDKIGNIGHYMVCDKMTNSGRKFRLVNGRRKRTLIAVRRKGFVHNLHRRKYNGQCASWPTAWFVAKK